MRTEAASRHNLPLMLSSFIGREEELAHLLMHIADTRLMTLIGSGGCGKTRLALEVARHAQPSFADGCWLIEFGPLTDPTDLASAIAQALDLREQPGRALTDTLLELLFSRHLLLVFDNCEHVIASAAQLADTLLRACSHVRILATSRERLNVPGEIVWRVSSLATPEPNAEPAAIQKAEAVRLFADRAAAIQPQFVLDERAAAIVAHICRRLDGMPLAIELAAARIAGMTVDELTARLDNRFQLLINSSRTAPQRHQTLRATIDWSYALLPPVEQILLRRLAVFAGGWTLESAEAVCADRPVPPEAVTLGLLRLVDTSLVLADQQNGRTRYSRLETIRQYAHDRLHASGEQEQLQARHLDAFADLADAAAPDLHGPNQADWLRRLETELPNLRSAFSWGLTSGQADRILHMVGVIWRGSARSPERGLRLDRACPGGQPQRRAGSCQSVGRARASGALARQLRGRSHTS